MTTVFRLIALFRTNRKRAKTSSPPVVSSIPAPDPTEAGSKTSNNLRVNQETRTALELFQHNQKLPINSLPPEVLHGVFLPVKGAYDGHYTRLFCFRTVCRYWMEVIDSTPELWNTISSRLHPKLQARIIQNSRKHLLVVEYDEDIWRRCSGRGKKMAAFESLVEPSAPRWQALEYRRGDNSESDVRILSLPLHNLERIKIDGSSWKDQRLTLESPKLSYIEVRLYSLAWRSLSGLHDLILESTNTTLNELTVILQASPALRYLSLKKTLLRIGTEGPPNRYMSKICLPRLFNLHMDGAFADSSSFLLDVIEAPSLETFYVKVRHITDAEDHNRLCEAAGRHIGIFPLPRNQTQAQISIMVQDRVMMFGVEGRRITICNHTWTRTSGAQVKLAYIASLMEHLDSRISEEVKILDISYWDNEKIGECLHIVHSRFPRIDHIIVLDGGTFETEIGLVFQYLSSPSQLGIAEEWLLPKLTKLKLDLSRSLDTDLGDRILNLVRRRKKDEQTEDITELRITVALGVIDPSMVETLRQSVMLFDLIVVEGVYVRFFLLHALSMTVSESYPRLPPATLAESFEAQWEQAMLSASS